MSSVFVKPWEVPGVWQLVPLVHRGREIDDGRLPIGIYVKLGACVFRVVDEHPGTRDVACPAVPTLQDPG